MMVNPRSRPGLRLRAWLLAAAVSAWASFPSVVVADDLPELGEAARADFSPQVEYRLGRSLMNEIRLREPSYVDDQLILDYLNELGGRLVEASSNPTGAFQFFALRDSSVNAFALYGGFIGVNTGTILTAQTESELAGVLAHEIGHVTQNHLARQMAKEKQNSIPSLIAMGVGILAARSNADIASAAIVSAQAGVVQAQLAYTRDFEREADRVGFQTVEKAGLDVHGVADFFDRLQRAMRVYDNSAPVYLRSHPLTVERLSDMQNRAQSARYRQVVSSSDFYLVRARLRVQALQPHEAITEFESQLADKKYNSLAAIRYGLALAKYRAKDVAGAQRELEFVRGLKVSSPLVDDLDAELRLARGDVAGAQQIYRDAMHRFPRSKALTYDYVESLLLGKDYDKALVFLESQLQISLTDDRLYALQAKTYAAQGKRLLQFRAQAEAYYLRGELTAAVQQLQYAQKESDGNFYDQSVVDARLRELRQLQDEDERMRRNGG